MQIRIFKCPPLLLLTLLACLVATLCETSERHSYRNSTVPSFDSSDADQSLHSGHSNDKSTTTGSAREHSRRPSSSDEQSHTQNAAPKLTTATTNTTRSQPRKLALLEKRSDVAPASTDNDSRVPFWNIAHMINSIGQIENALSAGSNGIETDISFDSSGRPVETYHGFPCDCGRHCHFREDFKRFIQYLAKITLPPATSRLLVVLLDLKLKDLTEARQKEMAGRELARIINENLYAPHQQRTMGANNAYRANKRPDDAEEAMLLQQPPLRFVISINHATDSKLVRAFIGYMSENGLDFMRRHVGFDVGMNDDLKEISAMWDSMGGETYNIWQGDGLTNCANIVRGVERLKEAISIRNGQGHFRKVYYWTADVLYHIRSVLRLGIDAILTNQPQRVLQVLDETEFKDKYRLATPYDDPFQQFWIQPSAWKMSVPSLGEAVETVTNIHQTSTNFVKTLPNGISAALKKVQSTISAAIR